MSGELTWSEAFEAMAKGEECEYFQDTDGGWTKARIRGLELQIHYRGAWRCDSSSLTYWIGLQWRRVPAAPKLAGLPAKWRKHGTVQSTTPGGAARECAEELDAALEAGEWVDLRDVDAAELRRKASAIAVHSHVAEERERNFVGALLAVLREKAVRP